MASQCRICVLTAHPNFHVDALDQNFNFSIRFPEKIRKYRLNSFFHAIQHLVLIHLKHLVYSDKSQVRNLDWETAVIFIG